MSDSFKQVLIDIEVALRSGHPLTELQNLELLQLIAILHNSVEFVGRSVKVDRRIMDSLPRDKLPEFEAHTRRKIIGSIVNDLEHKKLVAHGEPEHMCTYTGDDYHVYKSGIVLLKYGPAYLINKIYEVALQEINPNT